MFTQTRNTRGRGPLPRPLRAALEVLTTPHGLDRYVELIQPTWSISGIRAVVTGVRRTTAGSVTISLRPNRNWTGFQAGQYTVVTVEIDGVRHSRCYSPAGSANDTAGVELTVKEHDGGVVSPWLNAKARPGLVVDLAPAQGSFTLPPRRPDRVVLVSGGSGITPVMSMLRTLCDDGYSGPVAFLHYNHSEKATPYGPELDLLAETHRNVRVVRVFTDEPGSGDLDGFFTREHLVVADPRYAEAETYVCGPPPLMRAVRDLFVEDDLGGRLHTEEFTLAEYDADPEASGGTVHFRRSGLEVVSDGRTLLDQAEAAGLRPESGCRRGICHTCVTHMKSGAVRNVVTGETVAVADADVQLCVNAPVGDVTIEL